MLRPPAGGKRHRGDADAANQPAGGVVDRLGRRAAAGGAFRCRCCVLLPKISRTLNFSSCCCPAFVPLVTYMPRFCSDVFLLAAEKELDNSSHRPPAPGGPTPAAPGVAAAALLRVCRQRVLKGVLRVFQDPQDERVACNLRRRLALRREGRGRAAAAGRRRRAGRSGERHTLEGRTAIGESGLDTS